MPPFLHPFIRYFEFSGRAGRAEFWQFMFFVWIISILLVLLEYSKLMEAAATGVPYVPVLSAIFNLLVAAPSLAVTFRRLHDRNKSGWYIGWLFFAYVPLFILIMALSMFTALWPLVVAALLAIATYSLYLVYELAQPGDWYENQFGVPNGAFPEGIRSAPATEHVLTNSAQVVDPFAQIERLAQLHGQGALSDEEFAAQKSRILGSL